MRWSLSLAVVAVCCLSSCGGEPKVCAPGKSEACTGPGGCQGGQACNAEGTGFGECLCAATGGGSGTGGGAATGGGSASGGGSETGGGAATGGGATTGGGSATGGGTGGLDAGYDGGVDAGVSDLCELFLADGGASCASGLRCTWVLESENPDFGSLRCRPNGSVADGGMCTRGAAGLDSGYDDCSDGLVCVNNRCKRICDTDDPTSCGGFDSCTRYSGLFANEPDEPAAGACNDGCDPLTQLTSAGVSCGAGQGCYTLTSSTTTIAVCAGAGTVGHNQTITGSSFANSCVPGAAPRRASSSGNTMECGGFCSPAQVTSSTPNDEAGIAPNSCVTRWGAAPPADPNAGESCRYFWLRESFPEVSRFSNTLGTCFKHAAFLYDSNADQTPDSPWPRCTTLTTGDVVPPIDDPPHNDAQYFGCLPKDVPKVGLGVLRIDQPKLDRISGWK